MLRANGVFYPAMVKDSAKLWARKSYQLSMFEIEADIIPLLNSVYY